jgi:hypothetical protein
MDKRRIFALPVSYLLLGLGLLSICYLTILPGAQTFAASEHTAASPSFVRIIHASPDVGTADVFVDGTKLLSSFAFGAVTGYVSIPPGPHKVQIALVGKGIGGSLITQTLNVSPGVAYTVAAIGTQQTGLSLEVFVDNNYISSGATKFRVYQLSPDAGSVNVAAGNSTLLNGISYRNASNYLSVAAGAYTFQVNSPNNNATLTASTTLEANTVASLFVVGMFNGAPKSALVTAQTQGLPGAPDTGSDPNAVVQMTSAPPASLWTFPLVVVSLLLIAGAVYLRRASVKR